MLEREYKILPVVDAQGRLVGLVDRAELLRAMVAE
jgi:CBS-domain-containing membrane protein